MAGRRCAANRKVVILGMMPFMWLAACEQLPVHQLFSAEDWRSVFPAEVKDIAMPARSAAEKGRTSPVLPSGASAVAVYECGTSCGIVVKGLRCRVSPDLEPPCSLQLDRQRCWIGRRHEERKDLVDVSCHSDSAVEHVERIKATQGLPARTACTVNLEPTQEMKPVQCPSLVLAPLPGTSSRQ